MNVQGKKPKNVRGKHEETVVRFTMEVRGTSKAVYDFGTFLNSIQPFPEHGVQTVLIRSELVPERDRARAR